MDNGRHTGYIAQEIEKVAPEFVRTGEDGYKQVSYSGFIPWITGAIKALYAQLMKTEKNVNREVASVKVKATELEERSNKLEIENARLKARLDQQDKEMLAIKKKLGIVP